MDDTGRARPPGAEPDRVAPSQGAPIVAAELAPQVRRARAEHEGQVQAAREREVAADATPGQAERHDVSGADRDRAPAGRLAVVHAERHLGPRRRERARRQDLEPRAGERALEPGGSVGVPHQAVGEDEGGPIDRARLGDAVAQVSAPAEVLHGRQRPRLHDADHSGVMAGVNVPAATAAASAWYSARPIMRKRTRSPGRSSTGSAAAASYRRSGVRAMIQNPPGLSTE